MADFKAVDRLQLQKAFAIAHRGAAEVRINSAGRKRLRLIAQLIWDACGDDGQYRANLNEDIETTFEMIAAEEAM